MASEQNPDTILSKRHDKFWLEDGSVVVQSSSFMVNIHRTLLLRHSNAASSLIPSKFHARNEGLHGMELLEIPPERGVADGDFETLLEYLYHDM